MIVQPFVLALLILSLIVASVTDVRSQKIPNWLTYPMILLAILVYCLVNGLHGLAFSAEGLGLGFAVLMPLYILGGTGAGDVKLMAAVGAALGPLHFFYAFLCIAIAGGIYAVATLLSVPGRIKELALRVYDSIRTLVLLKQLSYSRLESQKGGLKLRYGVAISTGALAYIFFEVYRGNIAMFPFH